MPILHCTYPGCANFFMRTSSQIARGRGRYCSIFCRRLSRRGTHICLDDRFWSKVTRCNHEEFCLYCCWPWKGAIFKRTGYGCFNTNINNQGQTAHRLAWELWNNRTMLPHLVAAHYCHNRPCCNPMHIHPATCKENTNEAAHAGRLAMGERHGNAKITEKDVQHIFDLYHSGLSTREIADIVHLSRPHIWQIVHRRAWKHVAIPQSPTHA